MHLCLDAGGGGTCHDLQLSEMQGGLQKLDKKKKLKVCEGNGKDLHRLHICPTAAFDGLQKQSLQPCERAHCPLEIGPGLMVPSVLYSVLIGQNAVFQKGLTARTTQKLSGTLYDVEKPLYTSSQRSSGAAGAEQWRGWCA